MTKQTPGILICGHGSNDPDSQREFTHWQSLIQQRISPVLFGAGFLEKGQPDIISAAESLINQGVNKLFVVPAMLSAGRHTQNDIPLELAKLDDNIEIDYLWHVINHPKLEQAAIARIEEVNSHDATLLFITHGSRNSSTNEALINKGNNLLEQTQHTSIISCFGQIGSPSLEQALELSLIEKRDIIAMPYYLFNGKPIKQVTSVIQAFADKYPDSNILQTDYLNDHPLVIDAFCETIQSAIQDGIHVA